MIPTTRSDIGRTPHSASDGTLWFRSSPIVLLSSVVSIVIGLGFLIFYAVHGATPMSQAVDNAAKAGSLGDTILSLLVSSIGLVAAAVLFIVVLPCADYLMWRTTVYSIDATTFHYKKGIFSAQHRRVPIAKIQNVAVNQTFLQRLMGFATVVVESAGSSSSHVTLHYIPFAYATRIRDVLVAPHAAPTAEEVQMLGEQAMPTAPEVRLPILGEDRGASVYEQSMKNLALSVLLDGGTVASAILLVIALILLAIFILPYWSVHSLFHAVVAAFSGTILFAVMLLSGLVNACKGYVDYYRFRAVSDAHSIRISRGLLSTKNQTIPKSRIHALTVEQRLLWRRPGLWRVKVLLAGTSGEKDDEKVESGVILPAGTLEQAQAAIAMIAQDFDVADPTQMIRVATQEWKKTVARGAFDEGEGGLRVFDGPLLFSAIGSRARWVRPITKDYLGVGATQSYVAVRHGRWRKKVSFYPHSHIQSVSVVRGPFNRLLKTATVRLHTVGTHHPLMMTYAAAAHVTYEVAQQFISFENRLIASNWVALSESDEARRAATALQSAPAAGV